MAKIFNGTFDYAANYNVLKDSPLDTRLLTTSFMNLLIPYSWQESDGNIYLYKGITVTAIYDTRVAYANSTTLPTGYVEGDFEVVTTAPTTDMFSYTEIPAKLPKYNGTYYYPNVAGMEEDNTVFHGGVYVLEDVANYNIPKYWHCIGSVQQSESGGTAIQSITGELDNLDNGTGEYVRVIATQNGTSYTLATKIQLSSTAIVANTNSNGFLAKAGTPAAGDYVLVNNVWHKVTAGDVTAHTYDDYQAYTFTADGMATVGDMLQYIENATSGVIDSLDYEDSTQNKKIVTSVIQTNGLISVTKADLVSNSNSILWAHSTNNTNVISADVNIASGENLLTLDGNGGLKTVIDLHKCTDSEVAKMDDPNIKEAYQLRGLDDPQTGDPIVIGETIKIYKDSSLYNVYSGTTADTLENMYRWYSSNSVTFTHVFPLDASASNIATFDKNAGSDTYTQTGSSASFDSDNNTLTYGGVTYLFDGYATPWVIDKSEPGNYTEATINPSGTEKGANWLTGITQTSAPDPTVYYITTTGDYYHTFYQWNGTEYTETSVAICFVYQKADDSYELIQLGLGDFLSKYGFRDGLTFDSVTKNVSVKLGEGLKFHETPDLDGNKKIDLNLFTDGQGHSGLQIDSNASNTNAIRIASAGSTNQPIYIDANGIPQTLGNVGSGINPVYLGADGSVTASTNTLGSDIRGVYMTNGTFATMAHKLEADVPEDAVFSDHVYTTEANGPLKVTNGTNTSGIVNSTVVHNTSTVVAGGYGANADLTINDENLSGTMVVPYVVVDQYGHVSSATNRTLSITVPDGKITEYTTPSYNTNHVSTTFINILTNNEVEVGDTLTEAVQKVENKLAGLEREHVDDEAVISQTFDDIVANAGLNTNGSDFGKYVVNTNATYINTATSLADADNKLDAAIKKTDDAAKYYAKSLTTGGTAAKTATLVNTGATYTLEDGRSVVVEFANESTASSPLTLNVNSTGAKTLVYNNELLDSSQIAAGATLHFVYESGTITINGTNYTGYYRLVGGTGSGSGTSGLDYVTNTHTTTAIAFKADGRGLEIVDSYVSATITPNAATYSSTWLSVNGSIVTPDTSTKYRIMTPGNYYGRAYTWNGSRYVITNGITQDVAVKVATHMIDTEGNELTEVSNLITITTNGITMYNDWDCGYYE